MMYRIRTAIVLTYLTIPGALGSYALRDAETVSSPINPTSANVHSTVRCSLFFNASVWLTGTQIDVDLASVTAPPDCGSRATSLGPGYISKKATQILSNTISGEFSFDDGGFRMKTILEAQSTTVTDSITNVDMNLAVYRGETLACLSIASTAIDTYGLSEDCENYPPEKQQKYFNISTPIRLLNSDFLTVSSSITYLAPSNWKALDTPTYKPSMTLTCTSRVVGYLPVDEVWQGVSLTFDAAQAASPPDCTRPLESLGSGYSGSSKYFTFTYSFAGEIDLGEGSEITRYSSYQTLPIDPKMSYLEIDSRTVGCLTSLYCLVNTYVALTLYTHCSAITDSEITQVFTFDESVTGTGQQPFAQTTNGQMLVIADIQTQMSRLSRPAVSTSSVAYIDTPTLLATLVPLADSNSHLSQSAKIILILAVCTTLALILGSLAFFVWRRRSALYARDKETLGTISLDITESMFQRNFLEGQQIVDPKLSPTQKKKDWRAPLIMLGGMIFGLAFAIGHHYFYLNMHGHPVQNVRIPQPWVLRIGNLLAFAVKVSLSISVGVAFVQLQWINIRQQPLRIVDIDNISSALGNFWSLASSSIWTQYPIMTSIAVICWSFPIVPVITPGTINVLADSYINRTQLQVPQLSINSATWRPPTDNDYPRPYDGIPLLSRMVMASASLGSILPIQVNYTNITYQLEIFAPAVKCESSSVAATSDAFNWLPEGSLKVSSYYSWVPVENSTSIIAPSCDNDVSNLDVISQDHARLFIMTNDMTSLNLFTNDTTGTVNLTECSLYNASYSINFAFEQSRQTVTIQNISYLNGVAFNLAGTLGNIVNTDPRNEVAAYATLMNTFNSLFLGSISFGGVRRFENGTTSTNSIPRSRNCTSIEYLHMDLLDSGSAVQREPNTLENLRRNVEILFQNITISLLQDTAFRKSESEAEMIPVNITIPLTTYHYNSSELVLTYTIALLVTIFCSLLGFHAFLVNGGSYRNIFSTFLRATRNLEFTIDSEDTGADPCPRDLGRALVVMTQSATKSNRAPDLEQRQHLIARKSVPVREETPS